jgi:hypothetical protein
MTMKINQLLVMCFLTMTLSIHFTNVFAADGIDAALDESADQYNKNKSNDQYKVVCRREAPLGSRIKKNVCRTVAMMNGEQRLAKEVTRKLRTSIKPE